MDVIFSKVGVHIADSDFVGNRHGSGHELFPTLEENVLEVKHCSWVCLFVCLLFNLQLICSLKVSYSFKNVQLNQDTCELLLFQCFEMECIQNNKLSYNTHQQISPKSYPVPHIINVIQWRMPSN